MEEELFELLNSNEFNKLDEYYSRETYLDILGVSRKELVHSNFLAWLFNPKANHGLGDYAIRKLLEMNYRNMPKGLKEYISVGNYEIVKFDIARELSTNGSGYLDLYMNLELNLNKQKTEELYVIVENKVESKEGKDQTLKYQQWVERTIKSKNVVMIYLTADTEENITSDRFVKVSYTELNNKVLKLCERKIENPNAKYLLSDYICCLSQPLLNPMEDNIDDFTHTVLAISDNEIEWVNSLIKKYEKQLLYIIDELVSRNNKLIQGIYKSKLTTFKGIFNVIESLDIDIPDIQLKLDKILNNKIVKIVYNSKEYRPYGKNKNSIGYLVRDMIENYVKENKVTYENLLNILNKKQWISPWVDELVTNGMPKDPDHFYMSENDMVKLSDCKIYVARFWTSDDAIEMTKLLNQSITVK